MGLHIFKHLHTINKHRFKVLIYCAKCGIFWRGLVHDLSKYSPTEFFPGAKYYQGNRSPIGTERRNEGYSKAWLHHKGRNRHHYEYWMDFSPVTLKYEPVKIPRVFLIEMLCDRISASRVYKKKNYTDASPLEYYLEKEKDAIIAKETRLELEYLLNMLKDKGEKYTFNYIRKNRKKPNFPFE